MADPRTELTPLLVRLGTLHHVASTTLAHLDPEMDERWQAVELHLTLTVAEARIFYPALHRLVLGTPPPRSTA